MGPAHERGKFGQPARTYIQHFCADKGCSQEDLPGAMDEIRVAREGDMMMKYSYFYELT